MVPKQSRLVNNVTLERSINNSIHFLDVNISIHESHIVTNWHRKSNWSGRYLIFKGSTKL